MHRFKQLRGVYANAHMGPRELAKFVLKLARTLADLEGVEQVEPGHVAEEIQYRVLDRGGGRCR